MCACLWSLFLNFVQVLLEGRLVDPCSVTPTFVHPSILLLVFLGEESSFFCCFWWWRFHGVLLDYVVLPVVFGVCLCAA